MLRLSSALWLIAVCGCMHAQCVLDPIRVQRIEGYVVYGFENRYRLLENAEIRLLSTADTHRIIASTSARKDGYFRIVDVPPGRYVLSVRSESMIPASVDVQLTAAGGKASKRLILAVLSLDATRECGGDSITVRSIADIDHVISSARSAP